MLGWRKLMLYKYYYKMSDMNKRVPFKHLNWAANFDFIKSDVRYFTQKIIDIWAADVEFD